MTEKDSWAATLKCQCCGAWVRPSHAGSWRHLETVCELCRRVDPVIPLAQPDTMRIIATATALILERIEWGANL